MENIGKVVISLNKFVTIYTFPIVGKIPYTK